MTIYFSSIGTCGFGDTCIFLHDRSSLKVCESVDTGWDIMQQKKRKAVEAGLEAFMDKEGEGEGKDLLFGNDGDNDDGNEGKAGTEKKEELPFACFICRKPFTNPVVNATGDDPSTAWKTKDGEWRLIGNQVSRRTSPSAFSRHAHT